MPFKFDSRPENVGYKVGAIPMCLSAGTTAELEVVQAAQGQQYSLLRAWQPSSLSYVTLTVDASGSLNTAGGAASTAGGSTAVDATLLASTAVVGHVIVDSMPAVSVSGSSVVDANLSSVGSTKLVGQVTVANPTTAVTLAAGSSNNTIGAVAVLNAAGGSTAVDATLSSAGSTRLVGQFTVANPTTSVTLTNPATAVTVSNPTTAVTVSSGLVLGPSTAEIGQVELATGTTGIMGAFYLATGTTGLIGTVANSSGMINGASTAVIGLVAQGSQASSANAWWAALVAGSSANTLGSVALVAGTTANALGSVALVAGSSANTIGAVAQGVGSSANAWYTQSIAFSSANAARTTVNTSVDVQVIAANASRKALIIASLSTAQTVAIGLTTGVMTTALANVSLYLTANSYILFGLSGGLPIYQGPIRAINITSTAVAGGVAITEFT